MIIKQGYNGFIISFIILFSISCRTTQSINCPEKIEQMQKDSLGIHWCGDDTILVVGEGVPKTNLKDIEKRKNSSKEAALYHAKYFILEKFKGNCISGGCGGDIYGTGISASYGEEITRVAKSGTVIDCIWDSSQNCTVLYKAVRPGLKQIVMKCSLE